MAQVNDVAQKLYDDLGSIGAMRQQKLSYFAQAWALAWTGRPLFAETIEAWPRGPVIRSLWRDNHYNRASLAGLMAADATRLTGSEAAIIDAVVAFYDHYDTSALMQMSHDEPWLVTRGDLPPDAPSRRIVDTSLIMRHYCRLAALDADAPTAPALLHAPAPERLVHVETARQTAAWARTLERLATD